jgi:predicted acyltransferase
MNAVPQLPNQRLASLDVFRGATIAAMILVNNPGSWSFVLPPLRHAPWHGWTPTDLIFPFFLFIVGVSISLALTRRRSETEGWSLLLVKIFRRSLILFALGLLLALFPRFDFAGVRIPGVLQRIAVCYLVVSLIYLKTGFRARLIWLAVLLGGYWAVLKWVPVPGFGPGALTPEGNLCGYLDALLLPGHLYTPNFDPEGILSTIPAMATVLGGTLAGDWLRAGVSARVRLGGMCAAGLILTAGGIWWHAFFPINKQLWTSSFVVFTAGAALLGLSLCYLWLEVLGWRRGTLPFLVYGGNALLVFVGSGLMARLLSVIKVPLGGEHVSLHTFIYQRGLASWAGPMVGSLLFPLALLLFWFGVLYLLYRRRIYVKI